MILRRLSQSLKEQNWTAIWIEFVLLVAGVFLGIQVANWNQERATDTESAVFTERLTGDLREEAWSYEMQIAYYRQVLANARRAADALASKVPLAEEALVVSAYRATQYNSNIRRRATYDELSSTGEMGLIRRDKLRDLAMRVYSAAVFDDIDQEGKNSEYRHWFRLHISHDVQQALSDACGDKVVEVGDFQAIVGSLDYPCSPSLSPVDLAAAASTLRNDQDALPMLRLRIANIETNVTNMEVYYKGIRDGLRQLAAESP
ncbi:MAG: hypothetical protein ABIQ62_08445 [Thermomonas sp.]